MVKPNNELGFSFSDLYPNMGKMETSELAVPENDDLEALHEDTNAVDTATNETSNKKIFLALGILFALVIFLGARG